MWCNTLNVATVNIIFSATQELVTQKKYNLVLNSAAHDSCEVRTEFIYAEESTLPLWSSGQSCWLQNGDLLCFLSGTN
jgi:hypothetical protein